MSMVFNHLKFKQLRKKKKVTVEEIADKIGKSSQSVYKYQSGLYPPDDETITLIADLLEVDSSELLKSEEELSTNNNDSRIESLESQIKFLQSEVTNWKAHADFLKRLIEEKLNLGKLRANRNTTEGRIIEFTPLSIGIPKQSA